MRLVRFVLAISAIFVFASSHAGTIKIRFLNGIQNSAKDMEDSKNALFNAYRTYKRSSMPALLATDFAGYPNPKDDWVIGDNIELAIQGTISGVAEKYAQAEYALKIAKAKVAGLEVREEVAAQWYKVIYQRVLTEQYSNYLVASNTKGTINIAGVVSDTLARLRSDLADGSSVVIVAHSQGNLFAEAINSQLGESERRKVRFVGVASVAPSTPDGRYVTFDSDFAVFGAFNGLRAVIAPFAAAPMAKTDDGYYVGPEGISSFWDFVKDIVSPLSFSRCVLRTVNCPSYMGHSFVDVYLNRYVVNSADDLTPVASKIVGMIGDSIDELLQTSLPSGTATSVIGAPVSGLLRLLGNGTLEGDAYDVVNWTAAEFLRSITILATYENPASYTNGHEFVYIPGTLYQGVGNTMASSLEWIPLRYAMPTGNTPVWAVLIDETDRARWSYVKIRCGAFPPDSCS